MAEAYHAVHLADPSTVGRDKLVYDDEDFLVIKINSEAVQGLVRQLKQSVGKITNEMKNSVFPNGGFNLVCSIAMPPALMLSQTLQNYPLTLGWHNGLWKIANSLPFVKTLSKNLKVGVISAVAGSIIFMTGCLLRRYALRAVLNYKGWLYEAPRQQTWATLIWYAGVRVLTGRNPVTYSFQTSLPRLPVPSLKQTVEKYIRSVEPIYSEEKMIEIRQLGKDFLVKEGPKLQRYAHLKSWLSDNYISDWWEKYVYLRGRDSIMINSNYYVVDMLQSEKNTSTVPTSRAANIIYRMLKFKYLVETEALEPMCIRDVVPMCMDQYKRLFGTCRIPGEECDEIIHYSPEESNFIVVLCKGSYFKVPCYSRHGRRLYAHEIEAQLNFIIQRAEELAPNISEAEAKVAAFTAARRDQWAKWRQRYFIGGVNKTSLEAIQKCAFMVVLDENEPKTLTEAAYLSMHGDGSDRFFDKSFQLIVYKNGKIGLNCEHSWADAPVIGHLFEYSAVGDAKYSQYNSKGNCIRPSDAPLRQLPHPTLLQFSLISDNSVEAIKEAHSQAQTAIHDLHLHVHTFDHFGKGFIKKCKISPDAFIQIAFQIAFFKTLKSTPLTYESSMTRLFQLGRTETVRSSSFEVKQFVRSLCDDPDHKKTSKEEKIKLIKIAASQHQSLYRDAMTGNGIDRHLFGLYVISQGINVDSPFLKAALSEPWQLSTSQQPQNQTKLYDPTVETHLIAPGGGFGPVAKNGYGVSYMVAGEDLICYHVSSLRSCKETDSDVFAEAISDALLDLKRFFLN